MLPFVRDHGRACGTAHVRANLHTDTTRGDYIRSDRGSRSHAGAQSHERARKDRGSRAYRGATNTAPPPTSASSIPGRIAFCSDADGYPAVYVINADGTGLTRIADALGGSGAGVRWLNWSPDSQALVIQLCTQARGGTKQYYTARADGAGSTLVAALADEPCSSAGPTLWAPDSRRLALFPEVDDRAARQLTVVNADGTGLAVLTQEPMFLRGIAAWSRDGRTLLFSANAPTGDDAIFTIGTTAPT